jgi:site-specific recombinase XerD
MAEFDEHAAPNTQKKYRILLGKLKAFAESRRYVMVDQWTPIDVREMRTAWSVAPQTAAKNTSTVKSFFEYCLANDWIEKNPARLVKNQRGRDAKDRRGVTPCSRKRSSSFISGHTVLGRTRFFRIK